MPEMNGIEFDQLLKQNHEYAAVPVMMITIKKDAETRYTALDAGVTDFINKPVDMHECVARSKLTHDACSAYYVTKQKYLAGKPGKLKLQQTLKHEKKKH